MKILVLALLGLVVGCGYGPSLQLACSDLATAECQRRVDCSGGTYYPRSFANADACEKRVALQCRLSAEGYGSKRTPLDVEACAVAFPQVSCSDLFASILPSACRTPGARALGAPCSTASQCESEYCSNNRIAVCGSCSTPPVTGTSCVTSGCGPGDECVPTTGLCAQILDAGGDCSAPSSVCGSDLACVSNPQQAVCVQAASSVGTTCNAAVRCDAELGLECQGLTTPFTCQLVQYQADGAACGSLGTRRGVDCALGGACYDANGLVTNGAGTCKAQVAEGSACDSVLGPTCLQPARCVPSGVGSAGTCMLPDPASCH